MGFVYRIASGMKRSIPALVAKVGSVFLLIFAVGMVVGFWFSSAGYPYFVLLIPIAGVAIMWQKLDEGLLVFIALMAIALLFPEFFLV